MGYWWCPECKQEIAGCNVTYEEFHEACGTPAEWIEGENLTKCEQLEQENADLKRQLKGLTDKNKFFKESYKQRLAIEKEIAEMLGLEVDCGVLERIADKVTEHKQQLAAMRGALEFYADKDSYDYLGTHSELVILNDRGDIAREALKHLEGK